MPLSTTQNCNKDHRQSFAPVWQLHDGEPEVFNGHHDLDELLQVYRLGDKAVGMEVIGLDDILLGP